MAEDNINDPSVLTGIAGIVNRRKVNHKLNLENVERELMNQLGGMKPVEIKPINQELDDILKEVRTEPKRVPKMEIKVDDSDSSEAEDEYEESSEEEDVRLATASSPTYQKLIANADPSPRTPYRVQPPRAAPVPAPVQYAPAPVQYAPAPVRALKPVVTHAQEALQAYSGDINMQEEMIEAERIEEDKERMLMDIEDIRAELEDDGVDVSRIPIVNSDTHPSVVTKVYNQIKRKYNRSRCEDLGSNIFLSTATLVEMVFDGKKSYFGYKPNMDGWSRTVRSKMRRMRYEQSTIISNALDYYNIGPIGRIGLELIPSAFLHSVMRRETPKADVYMSKESALNDLREFDT